VHRGGVQTARPPHLYKSDSAGLFASSDVVGAIALNTSARSSRPAFSRPDSRKRAGRRRWRELRL